MKSTIVIIVIALIVGLAAGGIYFMNSGRTNQTEKSQTFADVQTQVEQGAKLYDVRTAEEFAAGHFERAENLPLADIQAGKFPSIDKETMLFIYCQSGNRSAQATELLHKAGFPNITDLGGLSDVEAIGGTLTK